MSMRIGVATLLLVGAITSSVAAQDREFTPQRLAVESSAGFHGTPWRKEVQPEEMLQR
jgi:hypothetical protein